jgi:hypothetical protein
MGRVLLRDFRQSLRKFVPALFLSVCGGSDGDRGAGRDSWVVAWSIARIAGRNDSLFLAQEAATSRNVRSQDDY